MALTFLLATPTIVLDSVAAVARLLKIGRKRALLKDRFPSDWEQTQEARELRNRLAKRAAENHGVFARLGHAAHKVCGLIDDDGTLDMSQELLPSEACSALLEAAREALTAANGFDF